MFILVNQKLRKTKNNTSEPSYEFRLAEVNRKDGLSLYSSVLNGSDRVDFISPEILHENVASHILQSKDINVDHVSSEVQYDLITTATSKSTSETTQEFFRKPAVGGGHCLFSSLCNILGISEKITIKDLRKQAANYNRQPGKIDTQCLTYETKKSLKQYCDQIENTNAFGGEAEIRAIAELYKIMIRVVKVNSQKLCVSISEHPLNETSFEKCCYIILENKHYESLHLRIDNNSNEERSLFDCNDEEVKKLMRDFIRKKYPEQMNQQQIKLKSEPAKQFGAQYLSDYEPTNEYKRDGKTKANRRCPTYVGDHDDDNNKSKRHSLTLLIPKTLVFRQDPVALERVKLEICIVTRTIDGFIYRHPYFKFYEPRNDGKYSLSNPMFIHLGYDDGYEKLSDTNGNLTEIDGILNVKLYLAVIHLLNKELVKEPIEPFESLYFNRKADIIKCKKPDELKKKFYLNDLRIAITPCIKEDDEEDYTRRVDLQYISEISTIKTK
ncbi:unnamed protein product [Rotaria sp. Silwood2]|nr:unnamed protein product [Rotaria sp. Silwood2]